MSQPDLLAAVTPVIDALDRLGVPYSVVGSVASSAHGVARASIDADLVADLREAHVGALVTALLPDYYVDRDAALDAVKRRSMFNAIHLATMLKVDIYVLTGRPFDRESFARSGPGALDPTSARRYILATPEDVVVHKLEWYRAGGEVADRQWSDIVGVLRVQAGALDLGYMRRWAAALGVEDLLDRAVNDAV
jgi:hypothetical protein